MIEPPPPSVSAFRASAWHYALGRIANALLAIGIFLLLARHLPSGDYAAYVVAIALLEILLIAANLGMDWVTAIEIPKLHQRAAPPVLRGFIARCLALQAAALVLAAALLAAGAALLAPALDQPALAALLGWYAAVLVVEGLSRAVRDQVLASLLLQWASQVAQALRNLIVLGVLLVLLRRDGVLDVWLVAQVELAASGGSLLLGAALLARYLRGLPARPQTDVAAPSLWSLRAMAGNAWTASLTSLLWGGQMIVLLVSRALGAEAAGLVGFGRNLSEQVRKLMPLEFLFHLTRTFLVTRQTSERDPARLLARVALCVKLNALFVLPLVLCVVLYGDRISDAVSAGRYPHAHWVVVGWLAWVVAWSHHRLADTVAHLLGRSAAIGRISIALAALPLVYLSVLPAYGMTALFVLLVAAELCYAAWVLGQATAGAVRYPWSTLALPKLGAAFFAAWIAVALLRGAWPALPVGIGIASGTAVFVAALVGLRPLDGGERRLMAGEAA